jgi:hypothetical protein
MAETVRFGSKMAEINDVDLWASVVRVAISFVSYHAFSLLYFRIFVAELHYRLS